MTTFHHTNLRRVAIDERILLLVEGRDDLEFLDAFLTFYAISEFQIIEVGSKDNFRQFLNHVLPAAPNLAKLEHLAIVRDADLDAAAAETSVSSMLQSFVSDAKSRSKAPATTSIRTSQFLFPDNQHEGTLETLLWATVPDGQKACVGEFLTCADRDWRSDPIAAHRVDKARVYSYLASSPLKVNDDGLRGPDRCRPGLLTGVSVRAGAWDLHHSVFDPLRDFAMNL